MATLILTAVGTAVGGPIGGAIGALIGQRADAAIFGAKARHGPRLGDLSVQTSSYGTLIPKIFGTMRVAGTVIWATDLKEEKTTSGGGKGQPKTSTYSYSASFAVAVSGRQLASVGRIWADGKLLRGASGDFKSRTGFRLYPGTEDQAIDPLIASAEGMGNTSAFRGVAYAVFEDFELGDYGGRIPSLTFELVAEAGPVAIGEIAAELSSGAVAAGETPAVTGYAASGDSVRGALEALSDAAPLSLVTGEDKLVLTNAVGTPLALTESQTGAIGGNGEGGRTEVTKRALGSVPDEVSIAYHDATRDYQTGLQRAGRGGRTLRSDRLALPAVLSAESAKAFAEHRLSSLWNGRFTASIHLSTRESVVTPGMHVAIEGQSGLWRVQRRTIGVSALVSLEIVRVLGTTLTPEANADPGRQVAQPDLQAGDTVVHLLDMPLYEEQLSDRAKLFVIAAGTRFGWRRASLLISYDGGASWADAGSTAGPAVMGHALTALEAAGSAIVDGAKSVEVELLNDGMWLEARNDAALAGGANLALLGDELVQFGDVETLGAGKFRLSRLLRGRRGTEWAAGTHEIGETFALIEPASLTPLELQLSTVGAEVRIEARGAGNEMGVETSRISTGETTRPPSPVHLKAERLANGDIFIGWVRRSRSGWAWLGETPLGEENEGYRINLSGAGFQRVAATSEPSFLYTAADQAIDGLAGVLNIEVLQVGTIGASRASRIVFT